VSFSANSPLSSILSRPLPSDFLQRLFDVLKAPASQFRPDFMDRYVELLHEQLELLWRYRLWTGGNMEDEHGPSGSSSWFCESCSSAPCRNEWTSFWHDVE